MSIKRNICTMNLLYNNTTKLSSDDTLMDQRLRAYLTVCRLLTPLEIEEKCIFAVVMPNNIGPIVTGSVSFYKYVLCLQIVLYKSHFLSFRSQ